MLQEFVVCVAFCSQKNEDFEMVVQEVGISFKWFLQKYLPAVWLLQYSVASERLEENYGVRLVNSQLKVVSS